MNVDRYIRISHRVMNVTSNSDERNDNNNGHEERMTMIITIIKIVIR